MAILSYPATRQYKITTVVLMSLAMGAVLAYDALSVERPFSPGMFTGVALAAATAGVLIVRRQFWDLADEVVDAGTSLRVRRGRASALVDCGGIGAVGVFRHGGHGGLVLWLDQPVAPFGACVRFLPSDWRTNTVDSLDAHVQALRVRWGAGTPPA